MVEVQTLELCQTHVLDNQMSEIPSEECGYVLVNYEAAINDYGIG